MNKRKDYSVRKEEKKMREFYRIMMEIFVMISSLLFSRPTSRINNFVA